MSAGFLLPTRVEMTSTERLCEEFPAYGSVLLRLAIPNLRTVQFVTPRNLDVLLEVLFHVARSFPPCSPCRHEVRTVSSAIPNGISGKRSGVQSLRIPSPNEAGSGFLLIVRTSHIVTPGLTTVSSGRYSDVPAYSQILVT